MPCTEKPFLIRIGWISPRIAGDLEAHTTRVGFANLVGLRITDWSIHVHLGFSAHVVSVAPCFAQFYQRCGFWFDRNNLEPAGLSLIVAPISSKNVADLDRSIHILDFVLELVLILKVKLLCTNHNNGSIVFNFDHADSVAVDVLEWANNGCGVVTVENGVLGLL